MSETPQFRSLTYEDYTIGWISPLPDPELVAALAMLDGEDKKLPKKDPNDNNTYHLGRIGDFNVVIVGLPARQTGKVVTARVAKDTLRSFSSIRLFLLVGIGGGAPGLNLQGVKGDIRLGDVVVSLHSKKSDAVVQYDFGKSLQGGIFERAGSLNKPPEAALTAISSVIAQHRLNRNSLAYHLQKMIQENPDLADEYEYQGSSNDHLFKADYPHKNDDKSCEECCSTLESNLVSRTDRKDTFPRVHYGTIGSADNVMKNSNLRDKWAEEEKIICFEMEAAGVVDGFPCLVIRGISDYADSHKNDRWQPYAAATAAAYAKELLSAMDAPAVNKMPQVTLETLLQTQEKWRRLDNETKCLQAFCTPGIDCEKDKNINPGREPETCLWFLDNRRFHDWRDESTSCLLWVTADPGCGKSVLSRALVDEHLLDPNLENVNVCYFFFKNERLSATSALSALLHQLFRKRAVLIKHALPEFQNNGTEISSQFGDMWTIIEKIASDPESGKIIFLLDALDECETSDRNNLITKLKELEHKTGHLKPNLKFLVTSRPCFDFEKEFSDLLRNAPKVELKGEKESQKINKEITQVIRAKVSRLCNIAGPRVRDLLLERLLEVENRTYLWLRLIFNIIDQNSRVDTSTVEDFTRKVPKTVEEAYGEILDKITDRETATRLLHIVVAASRPLTLKEMEVALYITDGIHSYQDLELQDEKQFEIHVRHLCGLFVSIVDHRIFLIHQTAKDYLVKSPDHCPSDLGSWKHSLEPAESNLILAQSCIWYLLLKEFENDIFPAKDILYQRRLRPSEIDGYANEHYFLDYSAQNWAVHFKAAEVKEDNYMLKLALDVCDISSNRFWTWFSIHWRSHTYESAPKNFSVLIISAYFGHEAVVKLLLEKADVNSKDTEYGRTPLSWAARNGHEAVVQFLLKKGADVNSKDKYDRTPLSLAAANGRDVVVAVLLEKGAGVDVNSKDSSGRTALISAVANGHEAVVKLLLEKGVDVDVNSRDKVEQTALLLAAVNGREAAMAVLLEKGAGVDVNSKDRYGRTALISAAKNGHEAMVKLLLKKGANVNKKDINGETALSHAVAMSRETVVRVLLEKGADVNWQDKTYGQTTLLRAAMDGQEAIVRILLEKGVGVKVNLEDMYGWTALWCAEQKGYKAVVALLREKGGHFGGLLLEAAQYGDEATVAWLLEKGADADAKNDYGWAALYMAASNGREGVVRLLLEKGADIEAIDCTGWPALNVAASGGHEAVVRLLLEKGADIGVKSDSGRTALYMAASNGHEGAVRLLLEKGADFEVKTEDGWMENGWTALQGSAANGHKETVRLLVEKGADVNTKDKYGWTALHRAAAAGHEAEVKLLVNQNDVDVNSKNSDGRTPLSLGADNGHEAVVKVLREKGASIDVNSKDSSRQTPLLLAAENEHKAEVQLPREKGAINYKEAHEYAERHEAAESSGAPKYRVKVTKVPHILRSDEFTFYDERKRKRTTIMSDWLRTTYDGKTAWAYQGQKMTYISLGVGLEVDRRSNRHPGVVKRPPW